MLRAWVRKEGIKLKTTSSTANAASQDHGIYISCAAAKPAQNITSKEMIRVNVGVCQPEVIMLVLVAE